MKTINEIIETLTPKERKQHKDLIDECLKRESMPNECHNLFLLIMQKAKGGIN